MCHTEPLLLVDDQQPEILEVNVAREQAVSSDHDINCPLLQQVNDLRLLQLVSESREHLYLHRKSG